MKRTFTCIVCPNGCEITVQGETPDSCALSGAGCPRGTAYVLQELKDPRRTVSGSVPVAGGDLPLVSVRLDRPVPKKMIFPVMEEISRLRVNAPVEIGQILLADVLGLNSNVIATRNVGRKQGGN